MADTNLSTTSTKGATVGSLDIVVKARTDQLPKDAKKGATVLKASLDKSLGSVQFQKFEKGLQSVTTFIPRLAKEVATLAPATTAMAGSFVAGAGALTAYTLHTAEATRKQSALGDSLGLSARELQTFEGAFAKVGAGSTVADSALAKFNDVLTDARLGTEDAQAKFEALGISVADLDKMDNAQAFEGVLGAIAKLGSAAEQEAKLSMFVDNAGDVLRVTKNGVEGLRAAFRGLDAGTDASNRSLTRLAETTTAAWQGTKQLIDGVGRDVSTNVSDYLLQPLVNAWSWVLKFKGIDTGASIARDKADAASKKSAAEFFKREQANFSVQTQLRAGARAILSYRKDQLKIEQEIGQTYKQASASFKASLVNQRIEMARVEFAGKIKDAELDILQTLDREAGLRAKIARDMQLATDAQKEQAFQLERAKAGAAVLFSLRASTPGGARELERRDLEDARKTGKLTEEEESSLNTSLNNRFRERMGGFTSPQNLYEERLGILNADSKLSNSERKDFSENLVRQLGKDQVAFQASLGKVASPFEDFKTSVADIVAAVKQGALDKTDAKRIISDRYAQLDTGPKMAESLDYGTDAFYKRIATRVGGYEKKDPNQRVAEYTKRSVDLLDRIDKKLGKQVKDEVVSIK